MPDWTALKTIIDQHQSFVLTCHVRPDADALGSELALAYLLRDLGKNVRIANPSGAPNTLEFFDEDDRVAVLGEGITADEVLSADVHIILDTSAWTQLQGVGEIFRRTDAVKVVIDHHVSSDNLDAHEFKDTSAEATGSLIFRFAKACGLSVPKIAATYLFYAIATDTGWFRFPSVTSETYRDVAELIDVGVKPHEIYEKLYERRSLARHHLSGRVLQRMTVTGDGLISWTWVSRKDFRETGAKPVDTEDLVNECRTDRMQADAWKWSGGEMQAMVALIGLQSRGMPMNVAIDGPAAPYWEQGKEMYYNRYGQLELSCASCHEENYGNYIRADHLSQGHINGFPTYRLKQAKLISRHNRFRGCIRDTRAETFAEGSDEFRALELYVASRGNGLSVETPAVRN